MSTMPGSAQSLINALCIYFPPGLSLENVVLVLGTFLSLYPLVRLHNNQRRDPNQWQQTAWMTGLIAILAKSFDPHDMERWIDDEERFTLPQNMATDADILYEFLSVDMTKPLSEIFSQPYPILATDLLRCVVCPHGTEYTTLRCREDTQTVSLLTANRTWTQAYLAITECKVCHT